MRDIKHLGENIRFTVTITILFALVVKNFFYIYQPENLSVPNKVYGFVAFWIFLYVYYEFYKRVIEKKECHIIIFNWIVLFNLFLIGWMILYLSNIESFSSILLSKLFIISLYVSLLGIPLLVAVLFSIVPHLDLIIKSKKNKAFIVVGYIKWGKSETLKQAFHKTKQCDIELKGRKFLLRTTSNSDNPKKFYNFIKNDIKGKDTIFPFNPEFDNPQQKTDKFLVNDCLRELVKTHKCFFFILNKNCKSKKQPKYVFERKIMIERHIDKLRKCGIIDKTEFVNKKKRADEFKNFIFKYMDK